MTDDRKRLLVSIASALILHAAVLILTGINSFNYDVPEKYGPLLVELSLPAIEQVEDVVPPVAEMIEEKEEALPAPAPEAIPEAAVLPPPEPVPAVPSVRTPAVTAAEVDDDFIAALRNRTAGTEGVDARALFGDDDIPAVTNRPDLPEASGAAVGSEVVLSDVPASREEDYRTDVTRTSEVAERSVIEQDDLTSLDASLSAGEVTSESSSGVAAPVSIPESPSFSGTSPDIVFEDQGESRSLSVWEPPAIPEEIREEGARRYTVVIEFLVDADGFTSGFRIKKPSGKAAIDAAVQSALRTWVFEEAVPENAEDRKKIPATLTYVIEIK